MLVKLSRKKKTKRFKITLITSTTILLIPFGGKTQKKKQNSANIMISVDGKGIVFPVILKLQGE